MTLINRRIFGAILTALHLAPPSLQSKEMDALPSKPETMLLPANGWVPNNAHLPVLLYRDVLHATTKYAADELEAVFAQNGWPPQWRNGIYRYHHFHSTAHEVLGIATGNGRVILGGENAREVALHAGDVAILPAGTGHCGIEFSSDFLVIGAYPPHQTFDICRQALTPEALARMNRLSFPASDPVTGNKGALIRLWQHP